MKTRTYTENIKEALIRFRYTAEEAEQTGSEAEAAYANGLLEGYILGLRAVLNNDLVDKLVAEAEKGTE